MKKNVKKILTVLVVGLALIGTFSLLKKSPQLDVPLEDDEYIRVVTGSQLKTGKAADSGLSGILNDSLEGVPPISFDMPVAGSSAPPVGLHRSTPAPAYGAQEVSEAPAFAVAPAALNEAPAFGAVAPAVDAPAFVEAPTFQPAPIAPVYGSQHTPPNTAVPGLIPPTPAAQPAPIAVPAPTPAPPPPAPPETTASPPPASAPPFWDVPSHIVTAPTPSSVPTEPRGASAVTVPSTWNGPATPHDATALREFSRPVVDLETFSSSEAYPIAATPQKFVLPQLKRLPQVEAYTPAEIAVASSPPLQTTVVPQRLVPDEYRPTSARNTMVLSSPRRASEEDVPKISFSTASVAEPPSEPIPAAEPMEIIVQEPPPASLHDAASTPPAPLETVEVLPFVPAEPSPEPVPVYEHATSPTTAATPVLSEPNPVVRETVDQFVGNLDRSARSGDPEQMKNAFVQLSQLYPQVNDAERRRMHPVLDRLALEVIFSCKNHLLEPACVVQPGDTIDSIAAKHNLSAALLMKINGLTGARPLKPGTELKVVVGQFDAKVSARRGELTLILGGLYAGRFPVTVGRDLRQVRGEFLVTSKSESFKGKTLTLGNGITLRGEGLPGESADDALVFTERNANELFDILTERSVIVLED